MLPCKRKERLEKLSKLSPHQTNALIMMLEHGPREYPKMSPPTRNALIALGYADYNTQTKVLTLTREGLRVSSVILIERK